MFAFVLILAKEKKRKKKRLFGYSVKVLSCPAWKLPSCSETGQAESISFSVNKQCVPGLDSTSAGSRSVPRSCQGFRRPARPEFRSKAFLPPWVFDLLTGTTPCSLRGIWMAYDINTGVASIPVLRYN